MEDCDECGWPIFPGEPVVWARIEGAKPVPFHDGCWQEDLVPQIKREGWEVEVLPPPDAYPAGG